MELKKFSISPANTFKTCPRKFYNEYVLGYEPSKRPRYLHLGDVYDRSLAEFDKYNQDYVPCLNFAQSELTEHEFIDFKFIFHKYYLPYAKLNPMPPISGGNQYGFGQEAHKGAGWEITGYIDKVSAQEINGSIEHVVVERKTTTDPIEPTSAYWDKLDLDPQIRSYVWAMKQRGFKAGWVHYEVIRKVSSKWISGLDRNQSPEDYHASLEKWFEKLGNKKTVVAHKRFYVTADMCNEFAEEHTVIRNNVLATQDTAAKLVGLGYAGSTAWYKHEDSCTKYGGCPFLEVCKGNRDLDREEFSKTHKVLK